MYSPRKSSVAKVTKVDLNAQCGLSRASGFTIRNGYLGKKQTHPTMVGRFSRGLRWSDTNVVLHSDVLPVASCVETQDFLEKTASETENSKLSHPAHAQLPIRYSRRVVAKRGMQAHPKYFADPNDNQNFLNYRKYRFSHNENADGDFEEDCDFCDYRPRPPDLIRQSDSNGSIPRRRKRRKANDEIDMHQTIDVFDLQRPISLTEIIDREKDHVSRNPSNYFAFTMPARW